MNITQYLVREKDQYGIAELHPWSPHHFTWQPSTQVSHTLLSSYMSHTIAATMSADG